MKCHIPFLLLAIPGLTHCSLVTVPVKTAGGIVNTAVKTSGRVVEAPFKAVSGGYGSPEKPAPEKDQQERAD